MNTTNFINSVVAKIKRRIQRVKDLAAKPHPNSIRGIVLYYLEFLVELWGIYDDLRFLIESILFILFGLSWILKFIFG